MNQKSSTSKNKVAGYAAGVIFWIAVWALLAAWVGNELIFAGPFEALLAFAQVVQTPDFWIIVAYSSLRVVVTGACAAIAGILFGGAAYKAPFFGQMLAPLMQVLKSAPIVCVIVIVLVAWGSSGALIVIVACVALPPFYVATLQALTERPRLTERVLLLEGVEHWRVLLACTWQEMLPRFVGASKTAVSLAWRAAVTAELLTLPLYSIGSGIYSSKLTLDSAELLVWTIVVMLLSLLNELVIVGLLKWSARLRFVALKSEEQGADAQCTAGEQGAAGEQGTAGAQDADAQTHVTQDKCDTASLELLEVSKSYGDKLVLDAFNLSVERGSRVCLMAPTGTGKSTTIGVLLGIETPDSGSKVLPERVGVVLQGAQLVENLTAAQNVALAAGSDYSQLQIIETLDEFLPEGATNKLASELSGGTRRLVELARAMMSPGCAIVLDEPFAGLDDNTRRKACKFIDELLDERPLILASHNIEDAELLGCKVVKL